MPRSYNLEIAVVCDCCGRASKSEIVTGKLATPYDPGKAAVKILQAAHGKSWGISPDITWCPACYKCAADSK